VKLYQVSDDGQSQTQTTRSASIVGLLLSEALEDVRQELCGDAPASISHLNRHGRALAIHGNVHTPPGRRKLYSITQQIPHHLLKPSGVAFDRHRSGFEIGLQSNLLGLSRGADNVDGGRNDAMNIHLLDLKSQLSTDDAADVQQVVDDLILRLRVASYRI
jgi:hypothetical protein